MVEHGSVDASHAELLEESHAPRDVAERWARALAEGDIDGLMGTYTPGATLHAGAEVILGSGNIRSYLEQVAGSIGDVTTSRQSDHGIALLNWSRSGSVGDTESSRLRVRRGKIVEQWIGDVVESVGTLEGVPIELSVSGRISDGDRAAAVGMIDKVVGVVDDHVLHVRIRLERAADEHRVEPVTLRATIELKGDAVRAHVSASTVAAAIDGLEPRLRTRLRRRIERRSARRHRGAESGPGEWRHGDATATQTPYFPRPVEEREVVRYKTVAPVGSTVEEALFDLDSMDYDFYLFVDSETADDAFVSRLTADQSGTGQVELRYLSGTDQLDGGDVAGDLAGVSLVGQQAPVMELEAAEDRLDLGEDRWIFYRDAETGRGHVLYRRYDGHYGLIVPADG